METQEENNLIFKLIQQSKYMLLIILFLCAHQSYLHKYYSFKNINYRNPAPFPIPILN